MNGCAGCFALAVVLFAVVIVIQAVATFWAPILGFSMAWMSWRYVRSWYAEDA